MNFIVVDFVLSLRGNDMFLINDHTFQKRKVLQGEKILWTCCVKRLPGKMLY